MKEFAKFGIHKRNKQYKRLRSYEQPIFGPYI